MTCECVSVSYPSARLLPLVNSAIEQQTIEKRFLEYRMDKRRSDYETLPRLKRFFSDHPDRGIICENWEDSWNLRNVNDSLSELRTVRLICEHSDTVRISGDCLARIDAWAGK